MQSALLLLAAAAAGTQAYFFAPDGSPGMPASSSRHFAAINARKGPDQHPNPICAPKKIDDHVKFATLNTTDVAIVENMLVQWMTDPNVVLENTGGSAGKIVTSNGIDGQACSFSHNPRHIDPDDMKILFDRIDCGKRDTPQMGWGYTDRFNDEGYYVGYGPTGTMPNCFDREKDLKDSD